MRKRITKFLLAQLILISFVFSNFGTMLKEVCTFAEQISSDGENTDKTTIITCGDFNSDGKINVFDLIRSKQHVLNKEKQPFGLADINADGAFNISDSLIIQDYILLRETIIKDKIDAPFSDSNPGDSSDDSYRYVIFSEDKETPLQINAQLTTTNGKIATNNYFEGNRSINGDGEIIENANISMVYMEEKIVNTYFSNPDEYDKFVIENDDDVNLIINNPTMAYDSILIEKSVTLNSCMMAMNDIDIKSNTDNTGNTVIYSKYGDINIDCNNINLVGLIYAPFGTVKLSAENIQIDGIIIAKNVIIDSKEKLNLNANKSIAEFIGVDTEKMVIPYIDWCYIDKPDDAVFPEIVEEQIYEDPLSVDDAWLEDNYGSLIVDEYSTQMKKELVECLYICMSEGITNLSDLIELFSYAVKGILKEFISLKTSLKDNEKNVSLKIGDYDISVEKEKIDTGEIYGPMPYPGEPFEWNYYITDSENKEDPDDEPRKFKIKDIDVFFKLAAAGVGTAVVNMATDAGEAIVGVGTAAAAYAADTLTSTVTKITTRMEKKISDAVQKGKDSLADIKNEAETCIKDILGDVADIDLFGVQFVPLADGFSFEIGENLKFDVLRDVSTWIPRAILNGEAVDIDKIKNVIDLDTLDNINSISPKIYEDIVSSIMSDRDPGKILDIIDCINKEPEKYKIAYGKLNDIDKAYSSVQEFIERYNSYDEAKYSIKDNGKVLKDNLPISNVIKPKYSFCAHHIVAKNEPIAESARKILAEYGIDIDSSANGVYLPGGEKSADFSRRITETSHFGGHSYDYLEYVNEQINDADKNIVQNNLSKDDAIKVICNTLDEIRKSLLDGKIKIQYKE